MQPGERGDHEESGGHEESGEAARETARDMACEILDRLRDDPDVPSPSARRLRELLGDRLPAEGPDVLAAFEHDPYAAEPADRLEEALVRLAAADPDFAATASALLRGSLGSEADEMWARRNSGKLVSVLWFVIPLALLWFVLNAIAAFSGTPPDLP
uniref:DUF1707 domain-containing protein n=1 Tax=Streptomyces sp. NBC_00049 TaxID=2903617 RepID=A0AAU2JLA5_9ACTN